MNVPLRRHITDSPPCKHAAVFRYVEAVWRTHPFLKKWVKTWRSWTGDEADKLDPDCTAGIWVRLTPKAKAPEADTERTTDAPLGILVEFLIPGTCAEDLMDLWDAFVKACYPDDGTFLRGLDAAGGRGYAMEMDSYGVIADDPASPASLWGRGIFACYVDVDTPV